MRNGISSSESIILDPWRSSALSGAASTVDLTSGNLYPTAPVQGRNVSMPRTSSSQRPTPASSPPPSFDISQKVTQAPAVLPSGGMSKEEKAAEIARRKEERKQVCVDFLHFMTSHKPYHVTAYSSVKGAKEELFQYELIFIWVPRVN